MAVELCHSNVNLDVFIFVTTQDISHNDGPKYSYSVFHTQPMLQNVLRNNFTVILFIKINIQQKHILLLLLLLFIRAHSVIGP
jgi:hypothetical protein